MHAPLQAGPPRGFHRQPRAVDNAAVRKIQEQIVDVEAPVADVPVTFLRFSSSTECWTFQFCHSCGSRRGSRRGRRLW